MLQEGGWGHSTTIRTSRLATQEVPRSRVQRNDISNRSWGTGRLVVGFSILQTLMYLTFLIDSTVACGEVWHNKNLIYRIRSKSIWLRYLSSILQDASTKKMGQVGASFGVFSDHCGKILWIAGYFVCHTWYPLEPKAIWNRKFCFFIFLHVHYSVNCWIFSTHLSFHLDHHHLLQLNSIQFIQQAVLLKMLTGSTCWASSLKQSTRHILQRE